MLHLFNYILLSFKVYFENSQSLHSSPYVPQQVAQDVAPGGAQQTLTHQHDSGEHLWHASCVQETM